MVFDKTGTITHGRPSVASVSVLAAEEAVPLPRLLAAVRAAESGSEHPLAAAVVEYVGKVAGGGEDAGRVAEFSAVPGCGLRVRVSGVEAAEQAIEESDEYRNYRNLKKAIPAE